MKAKDRKKLQAKLDEEMVPFRRGAKQKHPTRDLLRAIRQSMSIPAQEIANKLGIGRTAVFEAELRESRRTISLQMLERMAAAMECEVVYGVVPLHGRTLQYMAVERLWREVLGEGAAKASGQAAEGTEMKGKQPGSEDDGND